MQKIENNIPDIKYLGIPNLCFSLTEKDDKREEKYIKQRIERGFDDSEVWSLDATISKFILPRLKLFREHAVGYPSALETMEDWHKIIDKMIYSFEFIVNNNILTFTDKEYKKFKKGMNLFNKYFLNLWY